MNEFNPTFTVEGIADVNAMLEGLELLPKDGVGWLRLANKASGIIKQRTERGLDVRGNRFSHYSESYLEYKEKKAGHLVEKVNLHDDGNMFASMIAEKNNIGTGSRIFFADALNSKKAQGHNEGTKSKSGNTHLPQRQFFAISEPEAEELIELVEKDIDKYMAKL